MFCRFKDGLATLDVLNALEQHPALLMPFLCYSAKQLTADELESVFHVQLSPAGSTMRQEETSSRKAIVFKPHRHEWWMLDPTKQC